MAHQHGISLHKHAFGGNFIWVVLAIGVVVLIALSLLSVQWFILGVVVVAAVMCIFLFLWYKQHKLEFNDLSKLEELRDKTPKD